jgi:diguanylate cyclase (GGDEF)-like protein/PAS domain S-box-containing protein
MVMKRPSKLLIVDDEYFNRDMLKARLTRSGFDVAEAEDAQQALQVIQQGGIDLVLLDTMMPGMSGIDLLQLLRGVHGPNELPVIMATAVVDSDSISRALELGANDYVSKPIDFAVALARIRSQLSRREAELALRESEQRYALAMQGSRDGLWDWDLLSNEIFYSDRWKALIGCTGDTIGNSPDEWFTRVHPSERETLRSRLLLHWMGPVLTPGQFTAEFRMRHQDGTFRWMRASGHTVRNDANQPIRMTGSQTEITEQKVYDPLTGLPNRLHFMERAAHSLEQARQRPECGFAVLFMDIDRFKLVNDSMGHLAGDHLLTTVAHLLRNKVGQGSGAAQAGENLTIARFGGDEFAILVDNVRQPDDAEQVASRILSVLSEPVHVDGREVYCNVSIGVAVASSACHSVEDLLRDADAAMYAAKARGGAQFAVFNDSMRERAAAKLEIETGLRRALDRHELQVYYQPKVELETGVLVGFEALVRWNHPKLGLVPPLDFIPIAEETGQIVQIGDWVTREACQQMRAWQLQYPTHPQLTVSVNVSMRQFRQPDFVDRLAAILQETGLDPRFLQMEITESVMMEDPASAIATVKRMKALGVSIKLDDFGTGYSSLAYLCRMPIDALKIDRSFIVRMSQSETEMEIVRAVLALARSLQIEVVAEGIESDDQLSQLRNLGCKFGQGYYFGKPVSRAESAVLVAANADANSAGNHLRLLAPPALA